MLALVPIFWGKLLGDHLVLLTGQGTRIRWGYLPATVLLFVLWLVFLPNTCYLLTEWRHLLEWVDSHHVYTQPGSGLQLTVFAQAIFYLLYSSLGVLTLTLSIRPVAKAMETLHVPFAWMAVPLFALLSTGVYLGLIVRLNSWDLWLRPRYVLSSIVNIGHSVPLIIAVSIFAIILWALYAMTCVLLDSAAAPGRALMRRH